MTQAEVLQEFYNATTVLQAVLTFTHCTEDILRPEMDAACRRLIYARTLMRNSGLITDVPSALVPGIELPESYRRLFAGASLKE